MSTLDEVADVLGSYSYSYVGEIALQDALEQALQAAGLDYVREAELPTGRIDFLLGRVGVEVKVDGAPMKVLAQLQRYAHCVDELLLVSTKSAHRTLPSQIAGVRLQVLFLGGIR